VRWRTLDTLGVGTGSGGHALRASAAPPRLRSIRRSHRRTHGLPDNQMKTPKTRKIREKNEKTKKKHSSKHDFLKKTKETKMSKTTKWEKRVKYVTSNTKM
jgi:hypothetical protein